MHWTTGTQGKIIHTKSFVHIQELQWTIIQFMRSGCDHRCPSVQLPSSPHAATLYCNTLVHFHSVGAANFHWGRSKGEINNWCRSGPPGMIWRNYRFIIRTELQAASLDNTEINEEKSSGRSREFGWDSRARWLNWASCCLVGGTVWKVTARCSLAALMSLLGTLFSVSLHPFCLNWGIVQVLKQ